MIRYSQYIALIILLTLTSCFGKKTNKTPLPTPQCAIRIENDSLFVDGAIRNARTFGIPLSFQVDPAVKYDDSDAEQFRQDRLKNPRRVSLLFSEKINGYNVKVTLHPDDNNDDVGMAEWGFSKDGKTLKIDTGYSWKWKDEVEGPVKCQGEEYVIVPQTEMVQKQDSVIFDTPFCFKDVDFDGDPELCFKGPGYNKYYFNIFNIISPTKAEYMAGHPYNNIVYSDYDNGQTIFDYKEQTILVEETSGCCHIDHHLYKRRATVQNVLDPMEHMKGEEYDFSQGFHSIKNFEKGVLVGISHTYSLDWPSDYAACDIEAEYVSENGTSIRLQSLKLHDWDNEIWKNLYNKE